MDAITQQRLDDLSSTMDAEICERLHGLLSPCSPTLFIAAYLTEDPQWARLQLLSSSEIESIDEWMGEWMSVAWAYVECMGDAVDRGTKFEQLRDNYADALAQVCTGTADAIVQRMTDDGAIEEPSYYIEVFGLALNVRKVILSAQASAGRTSTEIARSVAARCGCNPETVLRFLRGTHDTTTSILGALMDELGLTITER